MDNLVNCPIGLSDCGQYFSYCTFDGRLQLWDTLSGQLKEEYTPSSHLSATCVRIVWPFKRMPSIGSPKKKRKRKTDLSVEEEVSQLELLAMGCLNGNILLYSVVKSDLHSQLINGHEDRVNDISWLPINDSIFSCSNDKHVIEWSISTSKIKQKFRPDNNAVTALCALDSSNVLTASNCIKWWNWDNKTLLKKFSGHATEVQHLRHVRIPDNDTVLDSYFLSSAVGDRFINAWQLKADGNSNSLASFSLDDEPLSLDISSISSTHPILVAIVTKSGSLHIFEHILNGHRKTPLKPKAKIQISTPNSNKLGSKQLMIFSAQISNDSEQQILLSYGNLIRPLFERISYGKCEKNTTLIRKDSTELSKTSLLVDSGFTKIKSPVKPKNATVMGPAGMAPIRQSLNNNDISSDHLNDANKVENNEKQNDITLSFEERLQISNKNAATELNSSLVEPPSSESLVHLLVQGLQSKDRQMLETVLSNNDEKLMRNTIKKLPIECIALFLYELQSCLFNKGEHTLVYLKWLEQLLHLRLTFLMTLPNIEEEFGPLLELLNARTHILDRIYRLKGRLNLMISQISAQNSTEYITRQKPEIDYESSSSSDGEEDEDMIDEEMRDLIDHSDNDNEDQERDTSQESEADEEENYQSVSEDDVKSDFETD